MDVFLGQLKPYKCECLGQICYLQSLLWVILTFMVL